MSFGFFRTIWVSIRAVNYTTNAFRQVNKGMSELRQRQLMLGKSLLQMGFIYMAMGGIVIQTLMGIMTQSRLGERIMTRFTNRVGKSLERLGASLARILEPILNIVAGLLEMATAHPVITDLIGYFGLGIAVLLTFAGTINILRGALNILGISFDFVTNKAVVAQMHFTATGNVAVSTSAKLSILAGKLFMVAMGFSLAFGAVTLIYQIFGKMPAIIAGVVIALTALLIIILAILTPLTLGVAAKLALLGAAVGGAIGAATYATMPEYQMGTTFVRTTGLAKVHRGERIESARESKVIPRMERTFQQTYQKTYSPTTVNIHGNLYTRSDKETMVPAIRRAIKEELDNKV